VERWAAQVAHEHGFTDVDHTVELLGLCAACSVRRSSLTPRPRSYAVGRLRSRPGLSQLARWAGCFGVGRGR
jgi:hypothetical protein